MKKFNNIKFIFGAALAGILIVLLIALIPRHGPEDISGVWKVQSVNGLRVDPKSMGENQLVQFDIRPGGACTMPAGTGKWTLEDNQLTLHILTYDGKTKEQFASEIATKFPGDTTMQRIVEKEFEDLKLLVDAPHNALTLELGSVMIKYGRDAISQK